MLQDTLVWKNIGSTAKIFVLVEASTRCQQVYRSCTTCAIVKPAIKKQGLYTPMPTPNRPWESISMDYMSRLPSTKHGNDGVFVVIDRFSKMAVLTPCKKSITVEDTTKLFFERVWVHFRLP
jgi:hypothetical protein